DDDLRALAGECVGGGFADAVAAAGDERHLPFEAELHAADGAPGQRRRKGPVQGAVTGPSGGIFRWKASSAPLGKARREKWSSIAPPTILALCAWDVSIIRSPSYCASFTRRSSASSSGSAVNQPRALASAPSGR